MLKLKSKVYKIGKYGERVLYGVVFREVYQQGCFVLLTKELDYFAGEIVLLDDFHVIGATTLPIENTNWEEREHSDINPMLLDSFFSSDLGRPCAKVFINELYS